MTSALPWLERTVPRLHGCPLAETKTSSTVTRTLLPNSGSSRVVDCPSSAVARKAATGPNTGLGIGGATVRPQPVKMAVRKKIARKISVLCLEKRGMAESPLWAEARLGTVLARTRARRLAKNQSGCQYFCREAAAKLAKWAAPRRLCVKLKM